MNELFKFKPMNFSRITLLGLLFGFASSISMFYIIFMAALKGGWVVQARFNDIGEGPFELVMYAVFTIIGFLSCYMYMNKATIAVPNVVKKKVTEWVD